MKSFLFELDEFTPIHLDAAIVLLNAYKKEGLPGEYRDDGLMLSLDSKTGSVFLANAYGELFAINKSGNLSAIAKY